MLIKTLSKDIKILLTASPQAVAQTTYFLWIYTVCVWRKRGFGNIAPPVQCPRKGGVFWNRRGGRRGPACMKPYGGLLACRPVRLCAPFYANPAAIPPYGGGKDAFSSENA